MSIPSQAFGSASGRLEAKTAEVRQMVIARIQGLQEVIENAKSQCSGQNGNATFVPDLKEAIAAKQEELSSVMSSELGQPQRTGTIRVQGQMISLLRQAVVELETKLIANTSKNANALQQELQAATDRANLANEQLNAAENHIRELEEQVYNVQRARESDSDELVSLRSQVGALDEHCIGLENKNKALERQLSELQQSQNQSREPKPSEESGISDLPNISAQKRRQSSFRMIRKSTVHTKERAVTMIHKVLNANGLSGIDAYRRMDEKKTGFLSKEEIEAGLRKYGISDDTGLYQLLESMDQHGDNLIAAAEFVQALGLRVKMQVGEVQVEMLSDLIAFMRKRKMTVPELFSELDEDGGGSISHDEFKRGLANILHLSPIQVSYLLKSMDDDDDGEIDLEEFYNIFTCFA